MTTAVLVKMIQE